MRPFDAHTRPSRLDRRRFCLSLAATALMTPALTHPALAEAMENAALAPEIRAIKERGQLIVGMTRFDSPPFYYRSSAATGDQSPSLNGWDVEFARSLARLLDVELVLNREAAAFNDVVELASMGAVDVAISKLSITARRALTVQFTTPSINLRHALLVNRAALAQRHGEGDVKAMLNRDFDGRLGVIANSSYAETAKHIFTRATLREFANWDEVVEAVNRGAVDLAYRDELEVKKLMRLRPDLHLNLGSTLITDIRDSIAFAVPGRSAQLLSVLNIMLAQRQQFDANQLLDQYSDIFAAT
ncbi:ABC transporter substrate-binding protein [Aureimonas endophytica]|uniref:ABC transporter substrate-binding protein n=1 Tax=Aureimonas endophytica TaxID=2027858 RepID=A0A917E9I3_9HYPH|nr:transporter substrate-binding domain-containing protein [Aureimonas endophytica]GGE12595.1 ABC transporter substrate-binding protein [Aureimonas endophytica]